MKKILIILCLAASGHAAEFPPVTDPFEAAHQDPPLTAFEPNYAGIVHDHGFDRMQYQLSVQYGLIPLRSLDWSLGGYRLEALDTAFTGLYDFYLFDRGYQPVIPRRQNPGFYFDLRASEETRWAHLDAIQVGWFHESNGQEIGTLAKLAAAGAHGREKILRAWDYGYLAARFGFRPAENFRLRISPSLHAFTGATGAIYPAVEDIFWRPNDPPSYISDYDGLRAELGLQRVFPGRFMAYLELTESLRTGYNTGHFAEHWTSRTTLTLKTWHLPWMFYYHNGYGAYITDYNAWSEGWGVALRFWG